MQQGYPEYSITVQPDPNGHLFMSLQVVTTGTKFESYLARTNDYKKVAKILHDAIVKAGDDMKQQEIGLVVVKENMDAVNSRLKKGR